MLLSVTGNRLHLVNQATDRPSSACRRPMLVRPRASRRRPAPRRVHHHNLEDQAEGVDQQVLAGPADRNRGARLGRWGTWTLHHGGGTRGLPPARLTGVATAAAARELTALTNCTQAVARAQ
jgi:hypothetical protein